MDDNFAACLNVVLVSEGGFSDNPADPGGATNLGVTLNTLSAFRGSPQTVDDVKALTTADVEPIYRANYWLPLKCDELPDGVDLMVFDDGMNAGPSRAAKRLQTAVGAETDGVIGAATKAAVAAHAPADIINELAPLRLAYYQSLSTFPTFGKGWTARVQRTQAAALDMASRA